jgi:hypothetical protein
MTLRIMLLGLVASMGFELPSGTDLERWTESGRNWVVAQMADQSVPGVEAPKPCVLPTDCLQAEETCRKPMIVVEQPDSSGDKAFEAVTNKLAADFAADLVAKAEEPKPTEPEPAPLIVAAPETPEVGLPAGEEMATQVVIETKVEVAEVVVEPVVPVEVTEVTETRNERLDRISTAVRLTKEAVHAWAEVIQDPVDETSPTR